jgi:RNA polymerase sigma-70 factor (ECF subfamily)
MSIAAPSSIADLVEDRVLNVAGRPIHHEDAYRVGLFSGAAENYLCGGAMRLDPESHAWLEALRADGPRRDAAIRRLHSVLLSEARHEVRRRTAGLAHPSGRDLDDLAVQAADDALVAILGKLDRFRGEALFTTWARRFAQLEVPGKIRRRLGHARETPIESEAWELRPASGDDAQAIGEAADLARSLGHLIVYELTRHQREVLVALTIDGVDTNDLAARLDSTPGALYKTLHDARCKLKQQLADRRQKDLHRSGSAADRAEAARISRRILRCAAA